MKSKRVKNNEKGFTIMEILAVITLIGFLLVLVVPNIANSLKQGRIKTTKSQVAGIESIIIQYYTDCGSYPTTEQGLKALNEKPSTASDGWNGPYAKPNQKYTDAWGKDLKYVSPGNHNPDSYDLYSFGPDGEDGGNDNIGNW